MNQSSPRELDYQKSRGKFSDCRDLDFSRSGIRFFPAQAPKKKNLSSSIKAKNVDSGLVESEKLHNEHDIKSPQIKHKVNKVLQNSGNIKYIQFDSKINTPSPEASSNFVFPIKEATAEKKESENINKDISPHTSRHNVTRHSGNSLTMNHRGSMSKKPKRSDKILKFDKNIASILRKKSSKKTIMSGSPKSNVQLANRLIIKTKPSLRIMICDDEQSIARSVEKLIKKYGDENNVSIQTVIANNGVACLNKICEDSQKGKKYDILLIDESMPFMSGSQCTKILKNMSRSRELNNIKIYSVTSYDGEMVDSIIENGCDGVLEKPITKGNLADLLDRYLKTL